MHRRAGALILLLPALALANPPTGSDPGWSGVSPGLEYREVRVGRGTVHQVRFDPARLRLKLLNAPDYRAEKLPVPDLVDRSHALAAVNGGYFDGEGKPMGYQRDEARVLSPTVITAGIFGGVFTLDRAPRLQARADFRPGPGFALQCGPRLISERQPIEGIHQSPRKRRTGIGYDGRGRVFLYATGPEGLYTFDECQKWLVGPSRQGGLDAVGALNLDGGTSTQFSLRGQHPIDMPNLVPVPVAVGVFPRS